MNDYEAALLQQLAEMASRATQAELKVRCLREELRLATVTLCPLTCGPGAEHHTMLCQHRSRLARGES